MQLRSIIQQPSSLFSHNSLQSSEHLMKCNKNIIYAFIHFNIFNIDYLCQHEMCLCNK
jgi:hypothetical protein